MHHPAGHSDLVAGRNGIAVEDSSTSRDDSRKPADDAVGESEAFFDTAGLALISLQTGGLCSRSGTYQVWKFF